MELSQDFYKAILIEKRSDGVAIATLNRPERLNAVGGSMHFELSQLPLHADQDPDVKALVITGAGRAFCSGGDFGATKEENPSPPYLNRMHEARLVVDNMLECSKPVISAVNGYALGLGSTIALAADIVVAGRSAVFGDTHVNMGLSAGDGGAVLWPMLIGPARAKYFLMTGEHVPAQAAHDMGLCQFLVEDDELMDKALEIAGRLAAGPTYAIMASKVPVNKWMKEVSNLVFPLSLAMEGACMYTDDHKEAVTAFQEKRQPKFTGR